MTRSEVHGTVAHGFWIGGSLSCLAGTCSPLLRLQSTRPEQISMSLTTTLKKTARKIEKAVTGKEPEVDLLDTLKEEHEEVAELLKKLVDSESAPERKSLLKQVKKSLVPHARAEEKVLYDAIIAIRKKGPAKDGEEGYLEHGLADKMLATLSKIKNVKSAEFSAAAKVLKELIEHHVEEEERDVWSDAKGNFSAEQRCAMNKRYLQLKQKVKIPA
jgi:hemerythrin-like domain-containing protein